MDTPAPAPAPALFQPIFSTYDGWDDNGPDSFMVYNATLSQDIKPFLKGHVANSLIIDFNSARLEIYEGEATYLYDLTPSFVVSPTVEVDAYRETQQRSR
jgi:hypothetical protein